MSEPRLAPLTDEELSGPATAFMAPMVENGRAWNIFRVLAHHPDLARRWMVFANHILGKSTLPEREREIAILRIGWLCQAEYEWAQHVVIGKEAGLSAAEIERIKLGADAPEWNDLDRLILSATDELREQTNITDSTWAALGEFWSTQQLMDLVFTVGQYNLVSMALNTLGVPLDDFLEGF